MGAPPDGGVGSVTLVAFAGQKLALAVLAAELIGGIASCIALLQELAAGQGVNVLWSEESGEPSGEEQQHPNQPEHLLAHRTSFWALGIWPGSSTLYSAS